MNHVSFFPVVFLSAIAKGCTLVTQWEYHSIFSLVLPLSGHEISWLSRDSSSSLELTALTRSQFSFLWKRIGCSTTQYDTSLDDEDDATMYVLCSIFNTFFSCQSWEGVDRKMQEEVLAFFCPCSISLRHLSGERWWWMSSVVDTHFYCHPLSSLLFLKRSMSSDWCPRREYFRSFLYSFHHHFFQQFWKELRGGNLFFSVSRLYFFGSQFYCLLCVRNYCSSRKCS